MSQWQRSQHKGTRTYQDEDNLSMTATTGTDYNTPNETGSHEAILIKLIKLTIWRTGYLKDFKVYLDKTLINCNSTI